MSKQVEAAVLTSGGTNTRVIDEDDLYRAPVHGPNGRIALLRRELGFKQAEFAAEIGTSRETVSHWENVDDAGEPRQRTTRRNAAAIAALARRRLGLLVGPETFFGSENQLETMRREQDQLRDRLERQEQERRQLQAQMEQVLELLGDITRRLD